MRFAPVAVVGQSCLLPGAHGVQEYWQALLDARDLLSPAPEGRWGLAKARVLSAHVGAERDCAFTDRGGYVSGFERLFDAGGFALPPEELQPLDPLFLFVLHAARQALRDAGHDGDGRRVGLVLGNLSFPSHALARYAESVWRGEPGPDPRNRFMSGLPAHLAARALRLGGAAFALDAACASSLYALKLACDALHDGRADVMLAGAVNRADDLFLHVGFSALQALSPSGRSRPFHRGADGLVPAEGSAFVVLKRLDDAIAARDTIHGVIRGIGLSNDGRGAGLLAPAEEGQRRALEAAYACAELRPADVSLLECHATGTAVGDATEIRSSAAVFRGCRDLPIGSVKSNLGHLVTVAGMAGILKVLAAMKAGVRPQTLHAEEPLPELAGSPFRLLRRAEPWDCDGVRRAGVSAFGFGGNNAHVVVEEWRGQAPERAAVAVPALPPRAPRGRIAVVGLGVVAADADGVPAFEAALLEGRSRVRPRPEGRDSGFTPSLELDAAAVRFPPRDLQEALPQQLMLLRAAQEAVAQAGGLPRERSSVLVGMQCDTQIARYGARWRLAEWHPGEDAAWLAAARDAFNPPLSAAGVVGTMPNICANRLNSQFDARGASLTLSAEELSGTTALELAARALRAGEVDAALVAAADVCANDVHERAAEALLPGTRSGDAAVAFVLRRLEDARADEQAVLALLEDEAGQPVEHDAGVEAVFGHAHAASGLLRVAGALLLARRRAQPLRASETRVTVAALGGAEAAVHVATGGDVPLLLAAPPRVFTFSGADRAALAGALRARRESSGGPARLAIVAADEAELEARAERAESLLRSGAETGEDGIAFAPAPLGGDLAFVFTAPAGSYRDMGRELALAFPEALSRLRERWTSLPQAAGWVWDGSDGEPTPEQKLWGSSLLCQLHAELTRGVLALHPHAAIGLCSGETNALYALGVWNDLDAIVRDISEARVYERELAGSFDAVRRFHRLGDGPVRWASYRVLAPLDALREALLAEPRARLAIVNAPGDAVIAGEADACARVLERVGRERARPLGYDMAVHCPELGAFAEQWRRIHLRPTRPVPGVRFYSHATCDHYQPTRESAADALLGQALATVDFPKLVQKAWQDGVRVFLEHGPQGGCARWISRILGDRPHLAVSLDLHGVPPLRQAAQALAQLWAAGVPLDAAAWNAGLARAGPARASRPAARPLRFAVARPEPRLPERTPRVLEPAPALPPVLAPYAALLEPAPAPQPDAGSAPFDAVLAAHARLSQTHAAYLQQQSESHRRFLELRSPRGGAATPPVTASAPVPAPAARAFTRQDLELHASGRISSLFGPRFAGQDGFARQVRMPEPPLLLADRVTDLAGEPGGMGRGSVWTETDVRADAYYMHAGRVPAGILIEAGQADLFLISWLGVDALNRGERVYRLLGCELTYHGSLPGPGRTLRYDIHVDGHARQGDVRLFFFHSDCRSGDARFLSVREGQAGFFTDAELAQSGGVIWEPERETPEPAPVAPPAVARVSRRYDAGAVAAFAEGRIADCFGPTHLLAETHVETPRIAGGRMLLIDEVAELDPAGGPWRRGYLRAVRRLAPDDWFFAGHFKNDPCMPGTLMFEGCLQAMAFYLAALGFSLDKDGWRFEPVPDVPYRLRCRGQATPASRELAYEVFVTELRDGPEPMLFADLLCTVDGVKAFHCRRMGLRLVPDTPLARRPEGAAVERRPERTATSAGLRLGLPALLACAWGKPSDALGPAYAPFDGGRRMPRLPGPPYHFMTRVTRLSGEIGTLRPGATLEVEYDVPGDAWYFAENGSPNMPFCVLLEAALQPCGWLALATGLPLQAAEGLHFRNLDGTGTLHRELGPRDGTLVTQVRLRDVSRSAGMSLVSFEVRSSAGGQLVFEMATGFGFFPSQALEAQVGLPTSDAEREWLTRAAETLPALATLRRRAPLPGPLLFMLDRVTGCWPAAGRARLGRWRAEKDVRPDEWFFKAHFHQDPVQPGSLGLQALVQLLQCAILERGLADGLRRPRFETLALGRPLTWKYRGQVVPRNQVVVLELELTGIVEDANGRTVVADGWLWVDGVRIYGASGLAMRVREE